MMSGIRDRQIMAIAETTDHKLTEVEIRFRIHALIVQLITQEAEVL